MAVQLPLPDPEGLPPAVLFHREHPSEPMLTLQVPNPGATDSETYRIHLDRGAHRSWMEGLPRSRWLMDLLLMEMHVVYEPGTGHMEPIRDLDEMPPFAKDVQDARAQASQNNRWEKYFTRRRTSRVPMSQFRMGLLGRTATGRQQQGRLTR